MSRRTLLLAVEHAFPARHDDRRHRIADEIGQAAAFANEAVDAEDQRHSRQRNGRQHLQGRRKRDNSSCLFSRNSYPLDLDGEWRIR